MARKLRGTAIQSGTINITQLSTTVVNNITTGGGPKVASITYPNSATAAVNTGNQSVVLTGTGFESGVQVYVNGSAVPAVSRANANSLSFTTPVLSTGATYPLYVVNPDGGTAVFVPGMVVSAGPVWVTESNLTSWSASSALSRTLQANSDTTVSYALEAESTLPSGLSLAANGVLSGTLSSPPASQTTYNFNVVATDLELQKSIKAFFVTATNQIQATGGTVSNIAGYRVHTFTSSGTFQVTSGSGEVEYLVVAGGGGGGSSYGGGGAGAGGYRTGTGYPVTAGNTYTITVGAGGAAGATAVSSSPGSNSVFASITSAGGGYGGYYWSGGGQGGASGGSGGGGGGFARAEGGGASGGLGNTPSTSPSQGNNGAAGGPQGGGGGGAGQAGALNGTGGNGSASSITGTSVTRAGGGGGGGDPGGASGGTGGGGAYRTAGTVNTGGGGGGGGFNQIPGGAGGSGIVIVRYAV